MTRKTITLTPKLAEVMNRLSEETGLTVSDLMRRAIESFIEKKTLPSENLEKGVE